MLLQAMSIVQPQNMNQNAYVVLSRNKIHAIILGSVPEP